MQLLKRNGKRREIIPPFESRLDLFRDELENVFDRTWRAFQTDPFLPIVKQWEQYPPVDLFEDEKGLKIQVDVPGFGPEDMEVEIEGRLLFIRGNIEEKLTKPEEKETKIRYERHLGNFARTITLPEYLEIEKIEAKYDKGMLKIWVPRLPGKMPKKVHIKT